MSLNKTSIEWIAKPRRTWNPVVGCSRRCRFCYARRIARARLGKACRHCGLFNPHLHPDRLFDLTPQQEPCGIFVCSMGELFDPALLRAETKSVLQTMARCPQHTFYLLTRRPLRMLSTLDAIDVQTNWWVGASMSTQAEVDEHLPVLRQLQALGWWTFASVEPILGPISIEDTPAGISWVIIGAETGPGAAPPDPAWINDLADNLGLWTFVKNNALAYALPHTRRQEHPE